VLAADLALLIRVVLNLQGSVAGWPRRYGRPSCSDPISRASWPIAMTRSAAPATTIITGIYGMNFRHMPELGWIFGYPLAIAIMAITVVVLRWYFTRVGWL
jgi:hypothetical protein